MCVVILRDYKLLIQPSAFTNITAYQQTIVLSVHVEIIYMRHKVNPWTHTTAKRQQNSVKVDDVESGPAGLVLVGSLFRKFTKD